MTEQHEGCGSAMEMLEQLRLSLTDAETKLFLTTESEHVFMDAVLHSTTPEYRAEHLRYGERGEVFLFGMQILVSEDE